MNSGESFVKKIWPFLASLSGATVMILAFFIPSIQDQWDRYQARKVIERYVELGNDFFEEERYSMAEEAYGKAFELSENKRLDIEVKRLNAKINRISEDPTWGSKPPQDLKEVDFQYLLHMQRNLDSKKQRVSILNSYGVFLSSFGRTREAAKIFNDAIELDSTDEMAYVNLGNLDDQLGRKLDAEKAYRKAILLDPENGRAHYDLGLLYADLERLKEAEAEFSLAVKLDAADTDALEQYHVTLRRIEEELSHSGRKR